HLEGAPRFAVVGYGKLGGKELGYASDLDLIFLYDDAREQAPETYARLAQRFNNWLTARTSAGVLFDTDLRLRPSGAAGLLVSPIEAFARYQEHDAWVWEHQALSRARYSAGDSRVGQVFESIRERILRRSREPALLAKEILAMREKMHAAHPNKSGLFDIKHDAGGMIDIEFTVQYLVLARAHEFPALTKNLGNIALLGMAAELGLLPKELAERCRIAYREYRRTQHALRLNGARLPDRHRHGDLPPEGAHRSPVQFRPYLHDEAPVHARAADGGAARGRAGEPARRLLHPPDRVLRLGEDGRVAGRRQGARRHRR